MDHSVSHTNSSYYTMVAVDENMKPAKVPGLILETNDEIRRFIKGKIRKEVKRKKRAELKKAIDDIDDSNDLDFLDHENCIVASDLPGVR